MVDRGDVDALRELLLVAQERGDVVPRRTRDVDDGLPVRVVEDRVGKAREDRGRNLVVGDGRRLGLGLLVILFTKFGVVGHVVLGGRGQTATEPSRWAIWIPAPPVADSARRRKISPCWIWSCRVRMPCMRVSGPGGQPGT